MTATEQETEILQIYKYLSGLTTTAENLTKVSKDFNKILQTHRSVIDLLIRRISELEASDATHRDQLALLQGEVAMLRSMIEELQSK